MNREATRTEMLLGLAQDQPEQQTRLARWRSSDSDVQTFRLASADLLGFSSRLRNESGHNLWLRHID